MIKASSMEGGTFTDASITAISSTVATLTDITIRFVTENGLPNNNKLIITFPKTLKKFIIQDNPNCSLLAPLTNAVANPIGC